MNQELAAAVAAVGGQLGGSILGLPEAAALEAASELIEAGGRIHVDLIDDGYPMRRGVPGTTLAALPGDWLPSVDLHYMVTAAPTIAPRAGVGRIIVHRRPGEPDPVPVTVRAAAPLWVSLEPQEWTPDALDGLVAELRPDGAVMMLVRPATAGQTLDLARIRTPAWERLRGRMPLGVDGGVVAPAIPDLARAGVSYFVCGRALFSGEGDAARAPGRIS